MQRIILNLTHLEAVSDSAPRKVCALDIKNRKKDEFMHFEQGFMTEDAYECKFHALYRYATPLVTTKKERICLF